MPDGKGVQPPGNLIPTHTTMKEYTVYTIKEKDIVKYVGCTCDFNRRKHEHLKMGSNSNIPKWVDINEVDIIPIAQIDNEFDALCYEDAKMREYDTVNNGWNLKYNNRHSKVNPLYRRVVPLELVMGKIS